MPKVLTALVGWVGWVGRAVWVAWVVLAGFVGAAGFAGWAVPACVALEKLFGVEFMHRSLSVICALVNACAMRALHGACGLCMGCGFGGLMGLLSALHRGCKKGLAQEPNQGWKLATSVAK